MSLWCDPTAFTTFASSFILRAISIPTSAWFWSESFSAPLPISCSTAARFASSLFAPISAARPGARRETIDNYVKRLENLETIAESFTGVEKAYAIQAGRELRVLVNNEKIPEVEVKDLARNIAKQIESDLRYPGRIKITMIRETRIIEYAR